MGYYTDYVISVKQPNNVVTEEFMNRFFEKIEEDGIFEMEDDYWYANTKWYDHEKDMIELSGRDEVKDLLFKVSGEGEDNDDVWVKYFKNGKMAEYRPEIVWPKFSEDDLQ